VTKWPEANGDRILTAFPRFSTVDKFASLPWQGEPGAFFGNVDRYESGVGFLPTISSPISEGALHAALESSRDGLVLGPDAQRQIGEPAADTACDGGAACSTGDQMPDSLLTQPILFAHPPSGEATRQRNAVSGSECRLWVSGCLAHPAAGASAARPAPEA
jgi:hypothetical protein